MTYSKVAVTPPSRPSAGGMTRHVAALVASLGALGAADPSWAALRQEPSVVQVVIEGQGFGHGVGMSQEGALAMARAGASLEDILQTFYPGTSLGQRGGTVRVELFDTPSSAVVISFPTGGQIDEGQDDESPGFPIDVRPGGSVRLSPDESGVRVSPLDGASIAPRPVSATNPPPSPAAPSTTTTVPSLLGIIPLPLIPAPPAPTTTVAAPPPAPWPDEPVSPHALTAAPHEGGSIGVPHLGRLYRGLVRVTASGGGVQLVNELDVEEYIRGMGEVMDPGWPAAALQAQAVAARTYALDAMAAGGSLCSSQQCQVYLGQTAEYAAMNRAVATTTGQVLTYRGALAEAVYSANTGGVTATPEEGFGMTGVDYPYLVVARHPTNDPQRWELRMPLDELARRFRYPGQATGVTVSRVGPSGRALEITFTGDGGPLAVPGHRFMSQLELRSTLFTMRTEGGPAPPETQSSAAGAPSAASRSVVGVRPLVLEAGGVGPAPLGRAPWTALAVLLLALWAVTAYARLPRTQDRTLTNERSNASAV